ncbi:MAG: hypothetical protein WCO66_00650 [Candidatus Absconditabacteria bacterium]
MKTFKVSWNLNFLRRLKTKLKWFLRKKWRRRLIIYSFVFLIFVASIVLPILFADDFFQDPPPNKRSLIIGILGIWIGIAYFWAAVQYFKIGKAYKKIGEEYIRIGEEYKKNHEQQNE